MDKGYQGAVREVRAIIPGKEPNCRDLARAEVKHQQANFI